MQNKQGGNALVGILYLVVWLAAIGGWIANIVKLVNSLPMDPVTGMDILRIVGIFAAPLGCIMGYL